MGKAIVLAIEPDKRRLSLGVKQFQPDVWETFFEHHAWVMCCMEKSRALLSARL
jgi:hypothetical protein